MPPASEPDPFSRYDQKTAQEAIALAARLQDEHRETMTVEQVESIAADVGVEPEFVRRALVQMRADAAKNQPLPSPPTNVSQRKSSICWGTLIALWWSLGWILPALGGILNAPDKIVGILGVLYPVIGIFISIVGGTAGKQNRAEVRHQLNTNVSREELLETLLTVEQQLAASEVQRAFLSIDVVGSSEMKMAASEHASEYSFGQYRRWVEQHVRASGGQLQGTAGDGIMCVFEKEAQAVEVANRLLSDLPRFNQEQNRLAAPFRIRCGVSVGKVAVDTGAPIGDWQSSVIDRAAILQKQAAPNTVVVGGPSA